MTIHHSGYDTTVGSGMNVKSVEHAIKEAFVKDAIYNCNFDLISSLNFRPVFITGQNSSESNIPFFAHPMIIKGYKGMNFICADVRPFVKSSDHHDGFERPEVRNQTEFNFAVKRLAMNMAWVCGEVNQIKLNLSFAGAVFAAWLSDTIAKRFALDPKDQMVLSIVSHYYYQSLFHGEDQIEEELLQKFAVHTIKATKAPSQMVFEVFDRIKAGGPMRSGADYCDHVKRVLENIRLEDLNVGLLITMIGQSWFGLNAKEILAVALEHPPTWIAIVHSSLDERTYRNSMIARISERYAKNGAGDEFLKNFGNMMTSLTEKRDSDRPAFRAFE